MQQAHDNFYQRLAQLVDESKSPQAVGLALLHTRILTLAGDHTYQRLQTARFFDGQKLHVLDEPDGKLREASPDESKAYASYVEDTLEDDVGADKPGEFCDKHKNMLAIHTRQAMPMMGMDSGSVISVSVARLGKERYDQHDCGDLCELGFEDEEEN